MGRKIERPRAKTDIKQVTYFFILFLLSFILFYLKYMDTEIGFESYEVKLKPDLNYASENDLERIYPACAELWNGSSSNVKIWSAISVQNHVLENATDEEGNFPSCETYFEKRQQFYEPSSLTEEEKNFPIAFSLVVYHNFEQIEQLFMSIYRTSNFYCIHIDNSASQQIQDQIRNLSRCFSEKVFVAKNSVDVVHSSISVLLAELVCIEELLKFSSEWKYLINLTGEELPLMTNLELVTVLTKLGGSNVIEGKQFRKKIIDDLLEAFGNRSCSEEAFFAILQYNNHVEFPGGIKVNLSDPENKDILRSIRTKDHFNRYKKWIVGDKKCESNNVQRFICMIGVKTLPELISSAYGRQLFINKFPWDFQPRAWDCILAWHFHKVQEEKITGRPALDHYSFLDNIQIKYSRKETENI